jgi:hypothetical protein
MGNSKHLPTKPSTNCSKRANFHTGAAWEWVKTYHPDIAASIRVEAARRYPSSKPIKTYSRRDLSFIVNGEVV